MQSSFRYNNDYYQSNSKQFNGLTRSMAQRRPHLSGSKHKKFEHRIEKACPTNSLEAYKKQAILLKKQLERMEKENLKKDHRIFQMQSNYTLYRQVQSELEETYRIIYMYEGKIQELEKQIKRLQHKVSEKVESNFTAQEIENLLNDYQNDNIQLRTTLEGQNRIIMELQERLKTIQSKYFQTSWKLSSQNRVLANPLKKKFPKLRETIIIQEMSLSQRQKMMTDLETKYNNLAEQKLVEERQKSKQNIPTKSSRLSKDKVSIHNNSTEEKELKKSRFSNSWETPLSLRRVSQTESAPGNVKVEKIQSGSKARISNEFVQEWQPKRVSVNKITYESYGANEPVNKKSQISMMAENPSMSLNYSVSQGPTLSQKSIHKDNGQTITSYRLSSSNVGPSLIQTNLQSNSNNNSTYSITQQQGYVVVKNPEGSQNRIEGSQNRIEGSQSRVEGSKNRIEGSQSRIASNSRVISNDRVSNSGSKATIEYKPESKRSIVIEGQSTPKSASSRIIRVSREKIEPSSYYQNDESATTYYHGASTMGTSTMASGSGEGTDSKKIRYVMRQAS